MYASVDGDSTGETNMTGHTKEGAEDAVRKTVERLIAEGRETGVQVVAYLDGRRVIDIAAGLADPEVGTPVTPDTLFNVFSVTKAVAVTALHVQVERGRLRY